MKIDLDDLAGSSFLPTHGFRPKSPKFLAATHVRRAPGLSSGDIRAFNRAILDLYTTQTAGEFAWRIHQAIRTLMAGDIAVVNWIDPRTTVSLACQYFPSHGISEELNALGQALLPTQSPTWMKCEEEALSVSDFMSHTDWMRRDIYQAMREISQEEYLSFDVRLSSSLMLVVADLRGKYGTYTPADRLKLQLLGPHLRQVYRRLAPQGDVTACSEPVRRRARLSVDASGRIHDCPAETRKILAAYRLSIASGRLPGTIQTWFLEQRHALEQSTVASPGTKPLRFNRRRRTLRTYLLPNRDQQGYHLILQEAEAAPAIDHPLASFGVSERESEVLSWLARGKANAEIAAILGVSPGTIRRHLENIFPKLGVDNRHAAVLSVMQAQALREIPR